MLAPELVWLDHAPPKERGTIRRMAARRLDLMRTAARRPRASRRSRSRAAERAGVVVRPSTLAELEAGSQLISPIWDDSDPKRRPACCGRSSTPGTSSRCVRRGTASSASPRVLGARRRRPPPLLAHHRDRPAVPGPVAGLALKQFQRAWALERGACDRVDGRPARRATRLQPRQARGGDGRLQTSTASARTAELRRGERPGRPPLGAHLRYPRCAPRTEQSTRTVAATASSSCPAWSRTPSPVADGARTCCSPGPGGRRPPSASETGARARGAARCATRSAPLAGSFRAARSPATAGSRARRR